MTTQTGVVYLHINPDQGITAPYTLVNVDERGNPLTQNPFRQKTINVDFFMWVLAIIGSIVACPVGIFSLAYAFMSQSEAFYPMRRYYRLTAILGASFAILCFVITLTVTSVMAGLYSKLS
ncbi:uncharacterized protein LOC133196443 isoform X2 [Saccostrea echinata]|uniref:uncharacterized protein LOC133196443 isoform X2 n=1 Tax=Saccostrea echinata TaxID=191078 RepID=UPI002A7FCC91|nr:uncharacterized protein LOC133196443 isoform X2 [Saccostrea echinata]